MSGKSMKRLRRKIAGTTPLNEEKEYRGVNVRDCYNGAGSRMGTSMTIELAPGTLRAQYQEAKKARRRK